MAAYKLAQGAKGDLQRIYDYGLERWGEAAADHYNALFDRFEEIAERPYSYPAVEHIRKGYRRSVCGVDRIYYRVDDNSIVEIMAILQSGVDISVIALWLGHESPTTTHHYVEADLAMKDRALARLQDPKAKLRRYRAPDSLLKFLKGL